MTDSAVVVVLLGRMREGGSIARFEEARDHVLVFVVRELDRELQSRRRIAKCVARFVTRRRLSMADGPDLRTCAFEELRAMTAYAGSMIRVVDDVGKLGPTFARNRVTRFALGLVLLGCVREPGVIDLSNTKNCY